MEKTKEKILLALLPVWDPLIPPLGISCLKSYATENGYEVKTVDANIEESLREVSKDYFALLSQYIPAGKRRHLYNIGHEVLKNHMMAHINKTLEQEDDYKQLVKVLVDRTFFHPLDDEQTDRLNKVIGRFFENFERYFRDLLETEKPSILGLSVYGGTLPASLLAFQMAKKWDPNIKTLMGGGIFSGELEIQSSEFKHFLDQTPYIDKLFAGEGEILFLKYLRGELNPGKRVYTLADIDGETLDISNPIEPDFQDYNLTYYRKMAAYSARSCPFQCTFCVETTYWGKYRKKSGEKIASEMNHLYKRYGSRLFLMCDSLLNPVADDLSNNCLNQDISLYWSGYLRADRHVCDTAKTMLWRRGGMYRARLGIESGSPKILEAMGKKVDPEQVKTAVSSLAHAGIKTTAMFVVGYPGETEADFQATLDFVTEMKDDIYEADCNPFWYFLSGQVNSDQWQQHGKPVLLYPSEARDMLLLQTWQLDGQPSREERYHRVNRFVEHCDNHKIPNPYSLLDTHKADERWKQLHRNAVPALLEFESNAVPVNESSDIKELTLAVQKPTFDGDWDF